MTEESRLQVLYPIVRVTEGQVRKLHPHGVDGKIATEGGFTEGQFCVGMNHKTAMAVAHFTFRTGEGKVQRQSLHGQMDDTECFTNQIAATILREDCH